MCSPPTWDAPNDRIRARSPSLVARSVLVEGPRSVYVASPPLSPSLGRVAGTSASQLKVRREPRRAPLSVAAMNWCLARRCTVDDSADCVICRYTRRRGAHDRRESGGSSSFAPNARPTLRSCWRFKTGSTASQTKRRNHAPRLNSRPVIANDTTCARQAGCHGNSDLAFDR